jgi:hypothetical protein
MVSTFLRTPAEDDAPVPAETPEVAGKASPVSFAIMISAAINCPSDR